MRKTNANPNEEAPLQIVIFGGTGDLANRKLIPALLDLYVKKKLPNRFSIIGLARAPLSNKEYRQMVQAAIERHDHEHTSKQIEAFCKNISYISGNFRVDETYHTILDVFTHFENRIRTCTNKMYYLAVSPQFYEDIFIMLHKHRMYKACDTELGWARVLVEKPFGSDCRSARKLDKKLGSLFAEDQIYRIDHYVAKEAVQNILSFRFANTLLRGVWNREYISKVEITMREQVDVENRGSFYDNIGAIRDVGQNHLLQLFALLTMNEPQFFEDASIRTERAKALKQLKKCVKSTDIIRAQYIGYKSAQGVQKGSDTETYFELKIQSNDKNWRGVPFYVRAGKALDTAQVLVRIHFKDVTNGLFNTTSCRVEENCIELRISPDQTMSITLNAKVPGLEYQIENRTLMFDCPLGKSEVKNSYEKVLLDCIRGDQTLFTTTEEVLASWRYIDSVLKLKHDVELQAYRKGSKGPKQGLVMGVLD